METFDVLEDEGFIDRLSVAKESQPFAPISVSVCDPALLNVRLFHKRGNWLLQIDSDVMLLFKFGLVFVQLLFNCEINVELLMLLGIPGVSFPLEHNSLDQLSWLKGSSEMVFINENTLPAAVPLK